MPKDIDRRIIEVCQIWRLTANLGGGGGQERYKTAGYSTWQVERATSRSNQLVS